MNMQESARLILGLRAAGWTDTEIVDFLLWIESGDEQYKPKSAERGAADGMTDKQFQSWVRFLLSSLKAAVQETDPEKKEAKMSEIMENLQKTLED